MPSSRARCALEMPSCPSAARLAANSQLRRHVNPVRETTATSCSSSIVANGGWRVAGPQLHGIARVPDPLICKGPGFRVNSVQELGEGVRRSASWNPAAGASWIGR
jgi:hypothetical protein